MIVSVEIVVLARLVIVNSVVKFYAANATGNRFVNLISWYGVLISRTGGGVKACVQSSFVGVELGCGDDFMVGRKLKGVIVVMRNMTYA